VRSKWRLQARGLEREQREMAGSTATFSHAVDNLPGDLELAGGCFSSARCRRGSVGVWEWERKQMRERGLPERAPKFLY
jgi:hypothetical protein